jgi:hypothetical protein
MITVVTIIITTIAIIQDHDPAVIMAVIRSTTDRRTWAIRASKSMIVAVAVAVVVAAVDW